MKFTKTSNNVPVFFFLHVLKLSSGRAKLLSESIKSSALLNLYKGYLPMDLNPLGIFFATSWTNGEKIIFRLFCMVATMSFVQIRVRFKFTVKRTAYFFREYNETSIYLFEKRIFLKNKIHNFFLISKKME